MLRMFDALKSDSFRWLWLGTTCSFFATQMQQIAQAWLAYEITHSALDLGIVTLAFGLPFFIISVFSGVIIDRLPKRSVIIMSQILMGVLMLALAILVSTGLIRFWHLVVGSSLTGIASSFNMPARQAIIQEIVPREKLYNAIALNMSGGNLARVAGPALAGALIGFVSTSGVYYCACGFFFIAIISLAKLPSVRKAVSRSAKNMITDLLSGLKYIRSKPDLQILMLMELFLSIFGMTFSSLMPIFAEIFHVQALGYGFLVTALGVGAFIGSISVATLGHFRKKGKLLLVTGMMFGILLVLFANSSCIAAVININNINFILPLVVLFFIGVISQSYTITSSTSVQVSTDIEYLGRVLSAWYMVIGMWPFGCFMVGAAAQAWSAPVAVTAGGVVLFLFMLTIAFTSRRVRNLE